MGLPADAATSLDPANGALSVFVNGQLVAFNQMLHLADAALG